MNDSALLSTIALTLEGLGIGMCVFDDEDRTVLWNRTFIEFFPEHDGQVFVGEPYRENLRRYYRSRLKADEFSQIAGAVPGMDSLLKAAPAASGGGLGAVAGLSQLGGSAGSMAAAAQAFSKLGLKPEMVGKAIPVLTSFVTKSGGANVGSLLAGALK